MAKKPSPKDDIITIEAEAEITPKEKARLLTELNRDRDVINESMNHVLNFGSALERIRTTKSFRAIGYKYFEDFLEKDLGFSKQYAARCIADSKVISGLIPFNEKKSEPVRLPTRECHVRVLASCADDAERFHIWDEANNRAKAAGKELSTSLLKEVATEIAGPLIEKATTKKAAKVVPEKAVEPDEDEDDEDDVGDEEIDESDEPDGNDDPPVSDFRTTPVDPLLENPKNAASKQIARVLQLLSDALDLASGPMIRSMDNSNRELNLGDSYKPLLGHYDRIYEDLVSAKTASEKLSKQWTAKISEKK